MIDPQQGKVILRSLGSSQIIPSSLLAETGLPPSQVSPVVEEDEEKIGSEISQDPENREGLLKLLTKAGNRPIDLIDSHLVGLDITTISLPVSINEPTSFLQRMCEVVAYYELLDAAAKCSDPCHRYRFS